MEDQQAQRGKDRAKVSCGTEQDLRNGKNVKWNERNLFAHCVVSKIFRFALNKNSFESVNYEEKSI
jgi:hypothetical protein